MVPLGFLCPIVKLVQVQSNMILSTSTQEKSANEIAIGNDPMAAITSRLTQFGCISNIKDFESNENTLGYAFADNNSNSADDDIHMRMSREVQLIKHVAREQALYNPKHEFYRNAVRKDGKWGEIGAAINWSAPQCKAKWKAFRDQYCRELKRSKVNPKAAVKWKYFKYLEFLRPFALSRNYRPRYLPNSNTSGTINHSNSNGSIDDPKNKVTAAVLPSDYRLLQSIKLEPKTIQDDEQQRELINEGAGLPSTMNLNACREQNIKNETIVVIAADQLQHLNNVLQQQQQQERQQSNNWSFLASSTDSANSLLLTSKIQSQQQSQILTNYNHNSCNNGNNNNTNNNIIAGKHMDHQTNGSVSNEFALLQNAFANCIATAQIADANPLSHQTQQQDIYMFQTSTLQPTISTSSDEEDDDPIHKFLNIESYFEKELIAMVQSEDVLYNIFHPNYRNAKRKLDVWADIARKMKKTVKQCRLKWKALRDQYIREHKRLRHRLNIETLPRWKHYDALNFLHSFIKHKSESEEKNTIQANKNDNDDVALVLKNQTINRGQQQQQLALHPALIGLSNGMLAAEQQMRRHEYDADIKNVVTIPSTTSTITTARVNEATATATTLVDITDNQSDSADEYEAMNIDNYINGDGDSNDIVMQTTADDIDEDDDKNSNNNNDDKNKADNDDDDIDDDMINDIDESDDKAVENCYNHIEVQNAESQSASLPLSDFRKLKDMLNQQKLCQNRQQHEPQQQQQQQEQQRNENDHIMQVVGLSCDDVVVLNSTNSTQLGYVVSSTKTISTTKSITTSATTMPTIKDSPNCSTPLQRTDFTENFVKLTTQSTVSPTFTLASLNTANDYFCNSNHNNNHNNSHQNTNISLSNSSSNSSNNNSFNSTTISNNINNNNDVSVAVVAEDDVGNVFSAIGACSNFNTNFDDCSRSTINAATSLPTTLISASTALTPTTPKTTTPNSNVKLSNGVLNESPVTGTITPTTTPSTPSTTATNISNANSQPKYSSSNDDDEVGVFFKAIAMKIRNFNLSPIEFTDLQIEVLRVINRSLRKN